MLQRIPTERRLSPAFGKVLAGILLAAGIALPALAADARIAIDLDEITESGAAPTWRVDQGAHIVMTITSGRPTELHLHGYDLTVSASGGAPGTLAFDAEIAGRFPLTRHDRSDSSGHHAPVAYLEIYPN